jgi:hypothetical protein
MLPETINLKDAQSIVSNMVEKGDFQAVEITFRFINGNGNGKSAFLTPDEFISNLNTAKTVKHLFYIWFQNNKNLKDYSPEEQTRVKEALNNKKQALLR